MGVREVVVPIPQSFVVKFGLDVRVYAQIDHVSIIQKTLQIYWIYAHWMKLISLQYEQLHVAVMSVWTENIKQQCVAYHPRLPEHDPNQLSVLVSVSRLLPKQPR